MTEASALLHARGALQKGGKGGKKGKGKGEGEEGVELTPEEREARAKLRCVRPALPQKTDAARAALLRPARTRGLSCAPLWRRRCPAAPAALVTLWHGGQHRGARARARATTRRGEPRAAGTQ